jgi:hypothetical protein
MRRLIHESLPAGPVLWLGEAPLPLHAPHGTAIALHVARPAPSAFLCLERRPASAEPGPPPSVCGGRRLPAGPRAGWLIIEAPPEGPLALRAAGALLPLSLDAAARPALRVWEGEESAIPETHWRAARVLGDGGVAALGAGPARPLLRLGPGGAGWITLPALGLPALPAPRIEVLRGSTPRHALHWGEPGAPRARGPAPITLALRAGLACEVLWRA